MKDRSAALLHVKRELRPLQETSMHENTEYSDPPLSEGRGRFVVVLVIPIKYFF